MVVAMIEGRYCCCSRYPILRGAINVSVNAIIS